jgi:hypothetical protein
MTTIVLSDAHGYPELIRNAFAHSGVGGGERRVNDRIVFAGDVVDRGERPAECLELLETAGAEMLWGNHDVAVLLDRFVYPCSGESKKFRPLFVERFRSGAWRLAACAGDVLITHAGVSSDYAALWEACGREPAQLAERLNQEFRTLVEFLLESGRKDFNPPFLGNLGPLWFRPPSESAAHLIPGLRQIVGHTPCRLPGKVMALRQAGVYLVDPDVLGGLPPEDLDKYRYAVVEGGKVRVEEGRLDASRQSPSPPMVSTTGCPRGRHQ